MIKKKHCSSCGHTFIDKDNQGNEGIYCRPCQIGIMRKIVAEYQEAFVILINLYDSFEAGSQKKFMALPSKIKRQIVNRYRDKGIIKFKIDEIQNHYYGSTVRN